MQANLDVYDPALDRWEALRPMAVVSRAVSIHLGIGPY
eukprot:COSAG01_NODE_3181_length_6453_cov_7.178155_3_plen_38_part_00